MAEQKKSILRAVLPRLAILLLFALSIRADELYGRSFAPGQEATEWTASFDNLRILLALVGILTAIGLLIPRRRSAVVDSVLCIVGILRLVTMPVI